MTWQPELDELKKREALARRMGGPDKVKRQHDAGRFCTRYAWPSARWGSLPLEGGIEAAYRAEINSAADPQAKLREIETRLNKLRSPFRTAETFWVEEMIDARQTRPLMVAFANLAAPVRRTGKASFTMRP